MDGPFVRWATAGAEVTRSEGHAGRWAGTQGQPSGQPAGLQPVHNGAHCPAAAAAVAMLLLLLSLVTVQEEEIDEAERMARKERSGGNYGAGTKEMQVCEQLLCQNVVGGGWSGRSQAGGVGCSGKSERESTASL